MCYQQVSSFISTCVPFIGVFDQSVVVVEAAV